MNDYESNLEKSIEDELNQLNKLVEDDVKRISDYKKYLAKTTKAYKNKDNQALSKLLTNDARGKVSAFYPTGKETFEKLVIWVKRSMDMNLGLIQSKLEEYCQNHGAILKGKLPRVTIDILLDVEVNEAKHTAKVGSTYLRKLEWQKLESFIDKERQRIWERDVIPSVFRDELLAVHARILKLKPNPVGWVRLEDGYQELKRREEGKNPDWKKGGRLVSYYKDEFSADLSMLWRAQANNQIDSPHVEFSGIRDPRLSYKVVLSAGRIEQYGHLRPRKEIS